MNVLAWTRSRLRARTDSEHEQALLRVLIGLGLAAYLLSFADETTYWFYGTGAYRIVIPSFIVTALLIFGCILAWPRESPARRVIANLWDIVTITFVMSAVGYHTAPLFSVYLWITFGCGFRFGPRYLLGSLVLSASGFAVVLLISDYWIENRTLGVGLFVGMVLLSLYVLTLVRRLHDAVERAEAANQAKRRFVSSVSHELRTPLNAIIGMNDLLRTTPLNVEQAEMADTMHSASRVMLSLIEDVLDFSKIEAGKLSVKNSDFDLHSLIQSTITIFSRHAASKGLKLGLFVMPDVPPLLNGDVHHLRQVLINLVGNAVKFTEQGEVRLIVSTLTENKESARLRFAIRDTGIGIPKVEQGRIFESFAQADSPSARKHRGTGLGTTIAKQLVELMGGIIGLESAPGAGSTFWFDLPFAKRETASSAATSLRDNRIMLVGFPDVTRRELVGNLQHWGTEYGVGETVPDAAHKMSTAATAGHSYGVALLYVDDPSANISAMGEQLRASAGSPTALLLCAPRNVAAALGSAIPPEFSSVIGLPAETRLLYNALHSVLVKEETGAGVVSLADYYQRKEPLKSYRVLVADDDQINRRVIAKQLEVAGHHVKLVADGEEALDALNESSFDLVILDSHMPNMNGLEATRMIRVMQAGRAAVPIILFSADATPDVIQEALDAGVDVFLPKPLEASRLYSTIEQLVARRQKDVPSTLVQPISAHKTAQVPILDLATLKDLERMSQDQQFVGNLVGLFREDSLQSLMKISEAVRHHRMEEFKSQVHALKGSALNLGAKRLYEHCSQTSNMKAGDFDRSAPECVEEFRSLIDQTHSALTEYVRSHSSAATS